MKDSIRSFIFCLLAILLFFFGCTPENREGQKQVEPAPVVVTKNTGPPKGGDFTLRSADGAVSLRDFRGKVVLLFFGYTACPTACPTSLETMANAFSRLSLEEMGRVQGIFVGIDPERDTPMKLKEYAGYFHPQIVGVTGTVEEVKEAAEKYGAYFIRSVEGNSAMGYSFSHSTETYLIDADGSLGEIFSEKTGGLTLSEAIRRHLWMKKS